MTENIYKVAFNSISAHIAILDDSGVIVETNRAWQEFARQNDFKGAVDCVGMNYIAICESARDDPAGGAEEIAAGIKRIIKGEAEEYFTQYPCHSPDEERWFALRAVRFRSNKKRQVVVTHENITPIMQSQAALEKKEQELQQQALRLEESNVALKVLLEHRELDRRKLEETILVNVQQLVLPYVEKLLAANLKPRDHTLVEIVDERLKDIISPFMGRLSAINKLLTPQEIQVASLIREGKTSKEISEILMLSVAAIDFHRKNLRKKLGLSRSGANLRSYLLGLQ